MKKLEDYIKENRLRFDVEEPSPQHLERFQARLQTYQKSKRVNLWFVASAAAVASVAITVMLSLMLNYYGISFPQEQQFASLNLSEEIQQIDQYYQYQVLQKQKEISGMISESPSSLEIDISNIFLEFNDGYSVLLKELSRSPRPERAASVLSQYYQTQIEVLESIINQINILKSNDNK